MQFSTIPGLKSLKRQLISGVERNHIAHAQLFFGKEGCANLPLALAYATYLNCENPTDDDSCGTCPSCQKNAKFIHPDFHFSFPVAANDQVKGTDAKISQNFLKSWRKFLLEDAYASVREWTAFLGVENKQLNISRDESRQIVKSLSLKAFQGNYKIMLIWLPEFLHPSAANALLKIIEEPPKKTIFLLVSNNQSKLLGTITSRTQSVLVPSYKDVEIAQILQTKYEVEKTIAEQTAHVAEGNLSRAVSLSSELADDTHDEFASWMRECYTADYTNLVKRSEEYHKWSKVNQQQFLIYTSSIFRESLLMIMQSKELNRIPAHYHSFVEKFSSTLNLEKIMEVSGYINKTAYHLERNASAKMTFLNLSMKISSLFRRK